MTRRRNMETIVGAEGEAPGHQQHQSKPSALIVPPLGLATPQASIKGPVTGSGSGANDVNDGDADKDSLTMRLKQMFQEIPREPFTLLESPPSSPRAHSKKVTMDHMEFTSVLFLSHHDQLQHYGAQVPVVSRGDVSDDVYFIFRGIVDMSDANRQLICSVHEGSFFGEHSYFYRCPRVTNITTASSCEIFRLDANFLSSMQRQFPSVYQRLRTVAMARHQEYTDRGMVPPDLCTPSENAD